MSPTFEQLEKKIRAKFPFLSESSVFGVADMIFDSYYEGVHDGIDRLSEKVCGVSHAQ